MTPEIKRVRLASIKVGERRRKKMGPIAALADSIDKHGLLHPIIVTEDNELVAGERRLRAAERLGWKTIPARDWGDLSDEEFRQIELAENENRLPLTSDERARELLAEINVKSPENYEKSRGRPSKGNKEVAEATGVTEGTVRFARKQVAASDTYPFFKQRGWKQSHVFEARDQLESIAPEQRSTLADVLSEPGVPPRTARTIISVAAGMPKKVLRETCAMLKTGDPDQVDRAKARLVQNPEPPPRRLAMLRNVISILNTISEDGQSEAKHELRSCLTSAEAALKISKEAYASRKAEGNA